MLWKVKSGRGLAVLKGSQGRPCEKGLTEQKLQGVLGLPRWYLKEEHSMQREQKIQMPWDWNMSDITGNSEELDKLLGGF